MRNVKKHIEEYQRKFNGKTEYQTRSSAFYSGEIMQIIELSNGKADSIVNALQYGFMVGYKYAKKEMKQDRKEV